MARFSTYPTDRITTYSAKIPDANGRISYTEEEHHIWGTLYARQLPILAGHACQDFLDAFEKLNLPNQRIPQFYELNAILMAMTGWSVKAVPALIPDEEFFSLLANKQFPAATFIRRAEDLDYLQEPDIFHEFFGHCPLIVNPHYASFMEQYGKLAMRSNNTERLLLGRLYWFTIEFGLIQSRQGPRAYGGGIISSPKELIYAIEHPAPTRKTFSLLEALRTPYRIDMLQSIYFIIDDLQQLFNLDHNVMIAAIHEADKLGDYPPTFSTDDLTRL